MVIGGREVLTGGEVVVTGGWEVVGTAVPGTHLVSISSGCMRHDSRHHALGVELVQV